MLIWETFPSNKQGPAILEKKMKNLNVYTRTDRQQAVGNKQIQIEEYKMFIISIDIK